ncbi:MAG: hypothetical protein ACYCW6_24890 [Candidatus Xenobia bacterium]
MLLLLLAPSSVQELVQLLSLLRGQHGEYLLAYRSAVMLPFVLLMNLADLLPLLPGQANLTQRAAESAVTAARTLL